MQKIHIIDSHTGGEPTRVVLDGGPDLGAGSLAEQRDIFRQQFDHFRRAIVNEPRGSDVLVGALLRPPHDPSCQFGVIFFNNVGYLGMCGHGTIGLMTTLAHLGRITPGDWRLETPVGVVTATLHQDGRVSVQNVPAYRHLKQASVTVPGLGVVSGDVAWGGNWFYLVQNHGQRVEPDNLETLTDVSWRIREALERAGITGADGVAVDHIELFEHGGDGADSRSFVLCPGKAYDRSPCGTGTSAKLACLFADGKISAGDVWRQESIVGSVFEGVVEADGERVIPTITGEAFVTAEATLLLDPRDPFRLGISETNSH